MTAFLEEMESQTDEIKTSRLHEMFPDTSKNSISLILQKTSCNFYRAFDELLNHTYFTEDPTNNPSKSIDAFSEDHTARRRPRKKKPRNKHLRDTFSADDADTLSSSSAPSTPQNVWSTPQKAAPQPTTSTGIQIIANHLPLPSQLDSASEDEYASVSKRGSPSIARLSNTSSGDSRALASSYAASRDRLLAQASSAYRRGKSNHLMLAAGAYYSQESRNMGALYREAAGQAADELVSRQSTSTLR